MLDNYCGLLISMRENQGKFFDILKETIPLFVEIESDYDSKKILSNGIDPVEWSIVLSYLDKYLEYYILHPCEKTAEFSPESNENIELILNFCEKYFSNTRDINHYHFINSMPKVLILDNWKLVLKALNVMKLYCRRKRARREEYPFYLSEESQNWLVKMALGINLNNKKKFTLLEEIREKNSEMHFEYVSTSNDYKIISENDEFNSTRSELSKNKTTNTINLDNLPVDNSKNIAKGLAEKHQLPDQLFSALWCKIRLVKAFANEESKQLAILASLYSYYILCKYINLLYYIVTEMIDRTTANKVDTLIEIKNKMIPELIEIIKCKSLKSELHIAAAEILSTLVDNDSSFRYVFKKEEYEYGRDVVRQLGIIYSANKGLLEKMLSDCTNLQIVKKNGETQLASREEKLEILIPETAENPEMLSILLRLLKSIYKEVDSKELDFEATISFWNAIKPLLLNTLQISPDDKYYLYQLCTTKKAVRILIWLTMKKQEQQQVFMNIEVILSRLLFELHNLQRSDEQLFYSQHILSMNPKLFPKLLNRQDLINSLVSLISCNISVNNHISK